MVMKKQINQQMIKYSVKKDDELDFVLVKQLYLFKIKCYGSVCYN